MFDNVEYENPQKPFVFPRLSKEIHTGCDVVDLDVSPDGLFVATIGATDAKGLVSEAKDGAKHCELDWIRNDYRLVWVGICFSQSLLAYGQGR